MLNLLSNAIKFTHENGMIDVIFYDSNTDELAIEVKDNGIGIAPEKIKKLFTPFTQVENIFTRAHAGSGLGLSLVKHLIELHGGHVEMQSEEGKGTSVTVFFPKTRVVSYAGNLPKDQNFVVNHDQNGPVLIPVAGKTKKATPKEKTDAKKGTTKKASASKVATKVKTKTVQKKRKTT